MGNENICMVNARRLKRTQKNQTKDFATKSILLLIALILILPFYTGCIAHAGAAAIVFNEIVSSNSHSLTDETLGSPDWIELYNTTDQDIDLSEYKLSSKNQTESMAFANAAIPAGGYLLVYAVSGVSGAKTVAPVGHEAEGFHDVGSAYPPPLPADEAGKSAARYVLLIVMVHSQSPL